MLVLSRRAGESICIRDNIIVTVLAVHGNRVRLGIQAPAHIPVHREEVAQRIQSIGGRKGISQRPPVVETDSGLGSEERQSSNQESSF